MTMQATELPDHGFTLIEVLVALFMVSLSLLAGFRAAGNLTSGSERQWLMVLAQICANNTMVQMRLNPQYADIGGQTRACPQAGHEFQVVTTVAVTPNPSFRRVDTQVLQGATTLLRISGLVGRY
jgi:general secretion pathway protein I